MNNNDIGKIIEEETEKRIEEMSKENYKWPEKANKYDYYLIIVIIIICLLLIALCMSGVIV